MRQRECDASLGTHQQRNTTQSPLVALSATAVLLARGDCPIVPRKSIGIAMLPTPALAAPLAMSVAAAHADVAANDPAACCAAALDSASDSHCSAMYASHATRQQRVVSECSDGAEVVPLELATLHAASANTDDPIDPIRLAETTNAAVISTNTSIKPSDATTDAPVQDAPSSNNNEVIGAPAFWSPSELFASIASDTFFGFLEAFDLTLSPAATLSTDTHSLIPKYQRQLQCGPTRATAIAMNFYVDAHGKTLLHYACRAGKPQVAKALLFHGIDALAQCDLSRTAWHDAIAAGDTALELVQLLHAHEPRGVSVIDANGSHIVHLAAIHGRLDVLQWYASLLIRNTKTNCADGTTIGIDAESAVVAEPLVPLSITSFSGRNLLHYAAYNGRIAVLQWALALDSESHAFAVLDASGYSLLHYAAMGGHAAVCEWLVFGTTAGTNNATIHQDAPILSKNAEGQTAFDVAKTLSIKRFVAQVAQLPPAPHNVRCISADASSLGVAWDVALPTDPQLRAVLAPRWFELEVCRRPQGITSASALLALALLLPKAAAATSPSTLLLKWDRVRVRMQPDARSYWLADLDRDTEYFVRVRAVNRNGAGAYSVPSLVDHEFATTNGVANGLRRILGLFPRGTSTTANGISSGTAAPMQSPPTFIGTLHFELLEARDLLAAATASLTTASICTISGTSTAASMADRGYFYSVFTLSVPDAAPVSAPTLAYRRRTVPLVALKRGSNNSNSLSTTPGINRVGTKVLYSVRSENAHVQDEIVRVTGSALAFQHPAFSVTTAFRVPEAADATLTIEIRHRTHCADASVGAATLSLMDFVRGLPAKLQWLALSSSASVSVPDATEVSSEHLEPIYGEVLIRTLFLADGITALPHPTRIGIMSSNAHELLDDSVECYGAAAATASCCDDDSDAATVTSSCSSSDYSGDRTAGTSITFDAMGFRVYDPRVHAAIASDAVGDSTTRQHRVPSRSYAYYRLLHECIDERQTQRWAAFHYQSHLVARGGTSSAAAARHNKYQRAASANHSAGASRGACSCHVSGTDTDTASQSPHSDCPYTSCSSPALQQLVWQGVPAAWRPAIYMRMSGALQLRATFPAGYFQSLLTRTSRDTGSSGLSDIVTGLSDTVSSGCSAFEAAEKQIQVDLQRTFAGNQCWINSALGQRALARVLLAYAVHNRSLGYCQSMTFIVGRLLCLFAFHDPSLSNSSGTTPKVGEMGPLGHSIDAEECVFWLLAVFCEQFFPTYYTRGMAGLQVDGAVLEQLMRTRVPKVYRHLVQLQTPHCGLLLVTQWLLPICCAVFPSETSFRMLDVLVLEGSRAVFALALALLRVAQHDLLAETNDYMQLFRFLKHRDMRLYDAALLLDVTRDEHAAVADQVDALRRECAHELEQLG